MKKKLLVLIFSTALFTMGFFSYSAYARTYQEILNDYPNSFICMAKYTLDDDRWVVGVSNYNFNINWNNSTINWEANNSGAFGIYWFNTYPPDAGNYDASSSGGNFAFNMPFIVIRNPYNWNIKDKFYDSSQVFDSVTEYDDYLNPPPEPSFWEKTWNGFWDVLETIGDGLEVADDALWNWIKSIYIDEDTTPDYNSILVTPAPTPTPIEVIYRQVTTPDGNGGSVTTNQYVYQDTNNNTVIATAIPTNGIVINIPNGNTTFGGNGNNGGGSSDPSNYSPANPLAIPNYSWLNPHAFAENQNQFPLETLQNSEDFTKEASENYLSGVTGIFSLLTFIPSELYAVIGIGISIIVIAGIMCKLLGG